MKLTVVIPCYNEASTIAAVLDAVRSPHLAPRDNPAHLACGGPACHLNAVVARNVDEVGHHVMRPGVNEQFGGERVVLRKPAAPRAASCPGRCP